MNRYRLRLSLTGPLGTPLSADTLFGHLCWGVVNYEGTAALEAFLADMQSPDPPLIIGDPLPAGFLPNPALPPHDLAEVREAENCARRYIRQEDEQGNAGDEPATPRTAAPEPLIARVHALLKRLRKTPYVPAAALQACMADLSAPALVGALLGPAGNAKPPELREATVAHNTINRLTGHVAEEGGLFATEDYFPVPRPAHYDVFILSRLAPDRIRTIFIQGLAGGYGRDASTGKGRLEVGDLDDSPWPDLPATTAPDAPGARPNAALALGVFAPAADDPAHGWYRTVHRFGKLGGAWATGPESPFKFPLLLLSAGAVLAPYRRPYLGRIVPRMHPTLPQVVTYAMCPVLAVRCPALQHAAAGPQSEVA